MSREPDDPKRPGRKPPDPITKDAQHIKRAHDALMNELKHFGTMREVFKQFLIYAWISETGLSPNDCVVVEQSVTPTLRTWHIAEKFPADARFREQYIAMKQQNEELREDAIRLHNKVAGLSQECDNLRRMMEDM